MYIVTAHTSCIQIYRATAVHNDRANGRVNSWPILFKQG